MDIHARFKDIDTIVLDVDGVLTDSNLLVTDTGHYLRRMSVRDGLLLKMAQGFGYKIGVITGGSSAGVKTRLMNLGATMYYDNTLDKVTAFKEMQKSHNLRPESILYIGDDLPDAALKGLVHLLCAPYDAVPEMLDAADYICEKKGGEGCVREVVEKVLKSRGHWSF